MENSAIWTIVNLVILIFSTWVAFRRVKSQNMVDDSAVALNYRTLVINLQAEVKESKDEIKTLKQMMENAHLEISLSVRVGEKPEITGYRWKTKIEEVTTP